MAVLKDYLKGIRKKPEDYIPAKLFENRLNDALSPSQFSKETPSKLKNFASVTKVTVSNINFIKAPSRMKRVIWSDSR